jgi:hypothetical protein
VDPLTGTERVKPADSSTAAIRRRGEDGASPNGQRLPSRCTPLYGARKGEGPIAANV